MFDEPSGDGKPGWADTKAFRNGFLVLLVFASLAAAIAGFAPSLQNHHPHFSGENAPEWAATLWRAGAPVFFAIYGFVSFTFIVLAGQHLRKLVGRKEDYYDERE